MWWLASFGKRLSGNITRSIIPQTQPLFSTLALPKRGFATVNMSATRDPCTFANYNAWRTRYTTVDFKLDFEGQRLTGSVSLDMESQTEKESKEVILDSRFVKVNSVKVNSTEAKWELKDHSEPFGSPLHIVVPEAAKGEVIDVTIDLETTSKCTALQWLTPAMTSNGKHPYMFSQCQAINARSIFPCQDTPDIKSQFSFKLRSSLPVVASGVPVGDHTATPGTEKVYQFFQRVPIPAYLFAVASGDIETAKIGPRSIVATGPNELAECKWELEQDMEKFMEIAEKLVFPYKWGEYNVLILPPSFPYGGMENPIYTFATPTIISGDRSNVDVIAHELSHSWSGNLVSNASWEHFWLNEGWTMYLERRIQAAIHGEAEFHFSAIIGWKALEDAVALFGKDHEYTKLIINHKNVDPEDVYSTVAYEKGFHMVYYLERVVGRENFDKFIPHYFGKWQEKSLDSFEFRDTFMNFFNETGTDEIKQKIAEIDWEGRFYATGLPPKPEFDTSLATQCYELANQWKDNTFTPNANDMDGFTSTQKLVFLETVQQFETSLTADRAELLGKVYDIASSKNVELKSAFYLIAVKANERASCIGAAELLGTVGRMKYVRPLFRALEKVDRDLALKTFESHKDFYHPICRGMVEKDLGLAA